MSKHIYTCLSVVVVISIATVLIVLLHEDKNSNSIKPAPKLLIDHDGGADDAMAIFIALLYEQYFDGPQLVAVTTNNGNVGEDQVFENSQRILDIAQRQDVPIYRGSKTALVISHPTDGYFGIDGLGDLDDVVYEKIKAQPDHAVKALIDLSKKYEGALTVLTIGPSTNIALAIRLDPHFISRLAHLYVAGGNIYSEKYPDPEFNALLDVEAYHVVAENAIPEKVTFIPFSPFYELHNISMDWRLNVLGAINTKKMQAQNQFERKSYNGSVIWNNLDPSAMAMVLDNTLIEESRYSHNSIILCGEKRGINLNKFTDCRNSNVKIAIPAAEEGFKTFLYDVFSSEQN